MNVLVFTNMFPSADAPFYGSFVHDEVVALRNVGVDVDVYFVNGRRSRWNYLGMTGGFFRRITKKKYDVVHVHHSYCGFVASLQARVPIVWTFHEGEIMTDAETRRGDEKRKLVAYSARFKRFVARRVDAVIVVAGFLAGPLGRPDAEILPSAVDTDTFRPMDTAQCRKRIGLDPTRRYILFPSTSSRVEKRFDLARSAVDEVRSRGGEYADIDLVCLEDVPHEEVPLYMNASEMLLMTSAFEASPITIREALACNVPVVSTDVGDARNVLEQLEGCYVVDPSPDAIAYAVERMLNSPRRISSREQMLRYSHESTSRRLVSIYERLAYSRPGRG